jgi:CRISPR-associated protein Csd1
MILAALNSLYERTVGTDGGPPPLGYAEVPIVGALNIGLAGESPRLLDLRHDVTVGKKTRLMPRRLVVPQPPKRTSGVAAGFLCDNAGYLLGHDGKDNAERATEQFAASRALHELVLAVVDDPAAAPILAFVHSWDPAKAADVLAGQPKEMATGWLVLRDADSGRFFHEMPVIRAAWERYRAAADAPRGQCLVTGRTDEPVARVHPPIKGIPDPGSLRAEWALVSFNCDSFSSYGKSQNLNAPIGATAAFAYTTALNHLLRPDSRRKLRIGDAAVVVWAERATPAEAIVASLFGALSNDNDEGDAAEENRASPVQDQLRRIAAGLWAKEPEFETDEDVRFFVLGLAPNAARLQLRFFYMSTLAELLHNLQQHCRDILLQTPEPGVKVPTLWALARESLPKDKDGRARTDANAQKKLDKLLGDLARAVLTGLDYPQSLLPIVLDRFRSDRRLTPARLGLVKGCINRHRRIAGGFEPEIAMSLDETSNEPGYLFGRLFALLENMQELSRGAAGRNQPTIRDRFIGAASVTPLSVFPYLLHLEFAHERKAKRDHPGIAHAAARNLGALIDRVGDFDPQLHPHQQGLFFIGYYHQRQARFAGRAADSAESETDQNEEEQR